MPSTATPQQELSPVSWTMVKKIDVAIQNTRGHSAFFVNLPLCLMYGIV
jgi:hypothetical protein